MADESVEVLVVGGGQAGVAVSEHLGAAGIGHLVLERDRIAERWRVERWDSLVANGPAWHDRFPGLEFDLAPDEFASKDQIVDYMVAYAEKIGAPIRTGVEVLSVRRNSGRAGFTAETTQGTIDALYVVAATGAFQLPSIPPVLPADFPVAQMHSSAYRNPGALAEGAVLVVGAGSSGVQIAEELAAAGRHVYLSVGPHERPPRSYRERDFVWWLGVLNKWDEEAPAAGAEHVTIAVTGAGGGYTVDFRELAGRGIELTGFMTSFESGSFHFAADLAENIEAGDATYLTMLDQADEYIARAGLDLPEEPQARELGPLPACALDPRRELSLADSGITTVIWATGYRNDFGWLQVDAFDSDGRPQHRRGVSVEPGVYFLGQPWQSRRGSTFIWGVWHDAKHVADHIGIQQRYLGYQGRAAATGYPIP